MSKLTPEDRAELTRQALLKRALELTQPKEAPDFGGMSDQELAAYTRKNYGY